MPSFQELFTQADKPVIQYKEKTLYWADKFPVSNGDKLKISIEKTNSEYIQGISIDITGSCEVQGKIWKKGKGIKMIFWEDAELIDPKNIEMMIITRQGYVVVQNVWECSDHRGVRYTDSGVNGAAMIIEEIPNGKRYYCNDGHPDENFDDIIFTIQKVDRLK
ncbi:MAG TPA: hypothetical protein PKW79_06360 [Rhabdochlamydiaceae bacterium]|nr:hypothetical protein [Rhabdochlamydiaceae bacterium]